MTDTLNAVELLVAAHRADRASRGPCPGPTSVVDVPPGRDLDEVGAKLSDPEDP